MFWKYEQCCFIKIQVACGWNGQQCHKGLYKACKYALPCCIAARWMCAFWGGRESGKLKLGAGWPLHNSGWGLCHTCEEVTGHKPMADMCQTVMWDLNCIAHHPQNLNTKSENAEYLCTKGTKQPERSTRDNIQTPPACIWVITNINMDHFFTRSWWRIRNGPVHMNLDWRDNWLVSPRLTMPTKMSTEKTVR